MDHSNHLINCNGHLVDLSTPKVMGILNVTPDSFYDGGTLKTDKDVLNKAETMLNEGATFLDVGAYSSRPNADEVSLAEELKRSVGLVKTLSTNFPRAYISIDTFRAKVAEANIAAGACIVNDISAGNLDDNMLHTVAQLRVPYIMMHMRGTPQTMMSLTTYNALINDIIFYFSERVAKAKKLGINDIILDAGFGFAKTRKQNFELLSRFNHFDALGFPLLAGISRKSTIYKTLNVSASEALNGTTAMHAWALQGGANILRVHDVKEANEVVTLFNELTNI